MLASDSEPPEQNQTERLAEIAEEMVRQNLLGVHMTEVSATHVRLRACLRACGVLNPLGGVWSIMFNYM